VRRGAGAGPSGAASVVSPGASPDAAAAAHGARVEVEGLRYAYGRGGFTLRVRALAVEPGEAVVCIGPSGSGKSTLLALIAGILVPQAGSVRVGGVELARRGDAERRRFRRARVGLVFQEFELLEHLSVRENVLLPWLLDAGVGPDADARRAADELLERTGIGALRGRKPRALSHGERQRVAICRALVRHPSLILADEPTGNLDPAATDRIVELLLAEARRRGATLLVVTHDHGLLERFDRVVDLRDLAGTEGA